MKRFLSVSALAMVLLVCGSLFAQKNVTKFLGIPVDGTKSAMIQKLKAKGFTYDAKNGVLEGEFNGTDVTVHIATDNNKVWRLMVADKIRTDEGQIRLRFNKLCMQFANNGKYLPMSLEEPTISEDEDISYQMSINHKQYDAGFYQMDRPMDELSKNLDTLEVQTFFNDYYNQNYTEEELSNMTAEQLANLNTLIAVRYFQNKYRNNVVWFTISEFLGEYYISMYYDNENNRSNGEDL